MAAQGLGSSGNVGEVFAGVHSVEATQIVCMESCRERGHRLFSEASCKDRSEEFTEARVGQPERSSQLRICYL